MELDLARLVFVAGNLAAGVVTGWLAVYAWRHRDVPEAIPFGGLATVVCVWAVADTVALLTTNPTVATVSTVVSTIADSHVAPLWVLFALAYTGYDQWDRPRILAALLVAPLVYSIVLVTAPLHSLADVTVTFQTVNGIVAPVRPRGAPFWLFTTVAYLLLVFGYYRLVEFSVRSRRVYRRQTATIVGASLFPLIANGVDVLGFSPHPGVDMTPLAFALAGAFVGWALFEYDFLTVAPLASDALVEELPDPVLVLDTDDRIVDHNQAAVAAFGVEALCGRALADVAPELRDRLGTDRLVSDLGAAGSDSSYAVFRPQTRTITDRAGRVRGRLLLLRDVTVQQRRLDRVEALQATTEQFIQARIDDQVAEIAVSFVEGVLDQEIAAVLLAEDDRLRPAALSTEMASIIDGRPPDVTPEDGALWDAYEHAQPGVIETDGATWSPISDCVDGSGLLLVIPLDEAGLLLVGSGSAEEYSAEDRQFANILAGATATAIERVSREEELRENRRIVRQRTEQLDFLNGVLRHNIRNGMQVIDSNADLLARFVDTDSDGQRHLTRIQERSSELATLTETIRSITDTLTDETDERLWPVPLEGTLTTGLGDVSDQHDVSIETDIADETTVLANDLLADVFESVVRNAIEHNDRETTRIEITVQDVGEWVQVHIADNGPGVSDHLKESLFERNVGISDTAHGFGLYFVAIMMDLYGGDVWFEDNDPRGAIAVLEFQRGDTEQAFSAAE
ncbi:histidine kinase N-terminal 7TM domain-containing protein [Halorhabdus sp. CUG00001]|uniref:sensor histidine kinase n=1 Tax=Halorhabdus sp. CUG00001 TaxID=2600297 RepID=UPI00131D74FF|nr:histidine kinase N-terminal 7TM domain-containing protein [Halorhabdus sp. CUG00001]